MMRLIRTMMCLFMEYACSKGIRADWNEGGQHCLSVHVSSNSMSGVHGNRLSCVIGSGIRLARLTACRWRTICCRWTVDAARCKWWHNPAPPLCRRLNMSRSQMQHFHGGVRAHVSNGARLMMMDGTSTNIGGREGHTIDRTADIRWTVQKCASWIYSPGCWIFAESPIANPEIAKQMRDSRTSCDWNTFHSHCLVLITFWNSQIACSGDLAFVKCRQNGHPTIGVRRAAADPRRAGGVRTGASETHQSHQSRAHLVRVHVS
ncbi:unnamed protein product [Sphagnum balticum]